MVPEKQAASIVEGKGTHAIVLCGHQKPVVHLFSERAESFVLKAFGKIQNARWILLERAVPVLDGSSDGRMVLQ